MHAYRAPRWLAGSGFVGGNLQTIWPALFARRFEGSAPVYRRERWDTPDGDFVDVDFQCAAPPATGGPWHAPPWLVLFHGLEGFPVLGRLCGMHAVVRIAADVGQVGQVAVQ